MKLHIGCGNKIFDGWVNLDVQRSDGVDIVDDASILNKIDNNSCDIIYACHILEHFGRNDVTDIIKVWHTKLKSGGTLRLSVPDFSKVVQRYLDTDDIDEIMGLVTGGHKDEFDRHGMIFDKKSLYKILISVKFNNVREWDWHNVEHGKYDDYSQAYLPHMQKENGLLMSLNLEATK